MKSLPFDSENAGKRDGPSEVEWLFPLPLLWANRIGIHATEQVAWSNALRAVGIRSSATL